MPLRLQQSRPQDSSLGVREIGFRYNLPEKGVAVSPFRYYYWMLFVMTNNFCCGTPIRNGLPVEKKTKVYFRYI